MNQTKSTSKKLLALLLALIMTVSLLPMSVFAAELATDESAQEAVMPGDEQDAEDAALTEEGEEDAEPVDTYAAEDGIAVQAATEIKYVTKNRSVPLADAGNMGYRIVHIDCGRKYFLVDDLKKIIDYAFEYGYTHVELAFGNDGLRFLLDDMDLTDIDETYTSEVVKSAIQAGNKAFYNAGTNELIQSEMDTLISYANGKGIGIIPMFDAPGHLQAVVRAMESLKLNPQYTTPTTSGTSVNYAIDPTDAATVNFVQALMQKYITYFAGKGCTMFNIAADECGFSSMNDATYTAYAKMVNSMAAMVQNAGMTALAFNDGIYYVGKTTNEAFDTDIAICYWDATKGKYAPAAELADKKFKIINTHNKWYYVIGTPDTDWYGATWSANNMNGTGAADYVADKCYVTDGGYTTNVGCMNPIWCDTPSNFVDMGKIETHISTLAQAKNNVTYFTKVEAPKEPELTVETPAADSGVKLTTQDSETHSYTVMVKTDTQNKTVQLNVTNATEKNLIWTSNKPEIATVKNGAVTFTGTLGTVTITATVTATGTAQAATQALRAATDGETVLTATFEVVEYSENISDRVIELVEGQEKTEFFEDVAYTAGMTVTPEDTNTATVEKVTPVNEAGGLVFTPEESSIDTAKTYVIRKENGKYLVLNSNALGETDDLSKATQWTATNNDGYRLSSDNRYLYYNTQNSSWTTTTNSRNATTLTFSNGSFTYTYQNGSWGGNSTTVTLGTPGTKTTGTPRQGIEVTFTGVTEGTTTVTIGNVRYTINVVPEELKGAATLPIQLWITNNAIKSDQAKPSTGTWHNYSNPLTRYAYYVSIAAEQAYGVNGVLLSELVPAQFKGYENDGYYQKEAATGKKEQTLVFWSGRFHTSDESNLQSTWGTDQSNAGATINYVRYWKDGGEYKWQISADRKEWTTVTGKGSTGRYT